MTTERMPETGTILDRIVCAKREEVASRQTQTDLDAIRARAADAAPALDFRGAVVRPGEVRLISEVKKASPSKGVIREDFDPVAIARAYEANGAAALSVLTDEPFFQGSLEIFAKVREVCTLPMLRKDFMIDPWQFYEARAAGADAVLLITSLLTNSQLGEFHALARQLRMSVLVETHSEEDIRRALEAVEPHLLGINNRDLHHPGFRTSLTHTAEMLPLVRELAGEKMPPVVSESGIHSADDVAQLRGLGVSTVLVGESLMRQPDPGVATRALMHLARD